ncbi:partial Alpha-xylosidase BoGH31A, partial [Anaerolineae bacterium]
HSEGIYKGQREVTEAKRVVNLTRSAYLGQQRYATITWSGDVVATWETLRKQIADGLNFCVTGVPYWTTDIGAFFVGRKPEMWFWSGDYDAGVDDLGYRELYVRWFQFGAFLPMFRAHGTDTPREIWRFGEPGDLMYDALAKVLQLRYRLLPYIYSLAGWTTHQAYTMLRALPFDFRHDPAVYNVADQFMLGPALLVNPITRPMYYAVDSVPVRNGRRTRSVYLPAGTNWYDFWTNQCYQGGQTIEASATLDLLPLYVRAGSIVPLGPRRQYVDDQPNAPIELHLYPGSDGCFQLYEDEGDNYRYEQGVFATIQIEWDDAARRLMLGQRVGQYPGTPEQREFRVVVHDVKSEERRINYDGQPIAVDL